MSRPPTDGCGCFPSGKHYAGIAHLLKTAVRGLVDGFAAEIAWADLPIALLDVETTGVDAKVDRVVELGIVIGRGGEIVGRHNWLINPEMPIPEGARKIHGISDDDVKDAPKFREIASEIARIMTNVVPGAYNANFDRGFVLAELGRAGVDAEKSNTLRRSTEWIDPLVWARELYSNEKSRTLGDMTTRLGIKLENAHRAEADAEAALKVLYAFGNDERMPKAYGAFISEQRRLNFAQADARKMWSR